ncbi:MAG TPA: DUF2752 domain-containing protein [Thermoanaerobaculia bacterium]|nr:DUF2752 domain-containing protein [Thermoanaerobaculia bacterium]
MRLSAGIADPPPRVAEGGRELGLLWGGVAIALVALGPFVEKLSAKVPACVFRGMTGVPCPTCGGTRAALALAHLDPAGAFQANPLVALGLVFLIGGGLVAFARALSGRGVAEPVHVPVWVRAGLVLALAANWFYLIVDGR